MRIDRHLALHVQCPFLLSEFTQNPNTKSSRKTSMGFSNCNMRIDRKKGTAKQTDIILLHFITKAQKNIHDTFGLHMQKHMMHDEGSLMRNLTSSISSNKQPNNKKTCLFNTSFPNSKSAASCLQGKGTSCNRSHEMLSLRYGLISKDG